MFAHSLSIIESRLRRSEFKARQPNLGPDFSPTQSPLHLSEIKQIKWHNLLKVSNAKYFFVSVVSYRSTWSSRYPFQVSHQNLQLKASENALVSSRQKVCQRQTGLMEMWARCKARSVLGPGCLNAILTALHYSRKGRF